MEIKSTYVFFSPMVLQITIEDEKELEALRLVFRNCYILDGTKLPISIVSKACHMANELYNYLTPVEKRS